MNFLWLLSSGGRSFLSVRLVASMSPFACPPGGRVCAEVGLAEFYLFFCFWPSCCCCCCCCPFVLPGGKPWSAFHCARRRVTALDRDLAREPGSFAVSSSSSSPGGELWSYLALVGFGFCRPWGVQPHLPPPALWSIS